MSEMLPETYGHASYYILHADVMIVAGTSLTVQPVAGLVKIFGGNHLVIINENPTPYDDRVELVINDTLGNVFSKLH